MDGDPLEVLGYQYDLACNGYELVVGRDPEPQARDHVQGLRDRRLSAADEVEARFGGMVNAFRYGAPPHGGCAAGIDRIVMLLADEANIREVIMFPMNQRAEDLMMGAPSEADERTAPRVAAAGAAEGGLMLDRLRDLGFDLARRNHAGAILSLDFPDEAAELVAALAAFRLGTAELIGSGGGEAPSTQRLRRKLAGAGWRKHHFTTETKIDGVVRQAQSHEIDHVRRGSAGTLALEIEWNNKDPFFDRDLENFQRLHAQSAISVGIVVTRGASLQAAMLGLVQSFIEDQGIEDEEGFADWGMKDRTTRQREAVARSVARGAPFSEAFARQFVADKFGPATTHWAKLEDRVARGVGNPCPLLLIGLPASVLSDVPVTPDDNLLI